MSFSNRLFTSLALSGLIFAAFNSSALADRYYSHDDHNSGCLSNWNIYKLTKSALSDLRQIDAGVTLRSVLTAIKSTGSCITEDEAQAAISLYASTLATQTPVVNNPPLISGSPDTSGAEGTAYGFSPSFNDPDGDSLSFSILNKPSWASFSTNSGSLTGVPGYSDAGTYNTILISVSDGKETVSLPAFSITIADVNRPPSISGTPGTSVSEGSGYNFTPIATDPDGDSLKFNVSNLPSWATFNTSNGTISGTPGSTDAGIYTDITIAVSDGRADVSLNPFSINVSNTNLAPSISGTASESVVAGEYYIFTPTATDPDGDSLSFSAENLPSWASFDTTTGSLSGIPDSADVGLYTDIMITVSDGSATNSLGNISIMVNEAPTAQVMSADLSWQIPTTRTDGSPLSLSDINGYRIYMGTTSTKMAMVAELNDGSTTSYSVSNLEPGVYYFAVTSFDTNSSESSYSNVVVKTL